ncbi:MAG: hypothetical protein ACRDZQ_11070 [Acidimicrobiales bacterium]
MGATGSDDQVGRLRADLARWAADSAAAEAAASRTREGWLRRQAAEDSTWSGLTLGWAERGAPVAVATLGGRAHQGRLVAVGRDFLLLAPGGGPGRTRVTFLASAFIATLRPGPVGGAGSASGMWAAGPPRTTPAGPAQSLHSRVPEDPDQDEDLGREAGPGPSRSAVDLAGALAGLAVDRPRVQIVAGSAGRLVGELQWVGVDILCLRVDAEPPAAGYVRLAAITEVSLLSPA